MIKICTIHHKIETKLFPLSLFKCCPPYSATSLRFHSGMSTHTVADFFGPASSLAQVLLFPSQLLLCSPGKMVILKNQ